MPRAAIAAESAVADMSPNPTMPLDAQVVEPAGDREQRLPRRILSAPSSTETAAVAQAATGWIIDP